LTAYRHPGYLTELFGTASGKTCSSPAGWDGSRKHSDIQFLVFPGTVGGQFTIRVVWAGVIVLPRARGGAVRATVSDEMNIYNDVNVLEERRVSATEQLLVY